MRDLLLSTQTAEALRRDGQPDWLQLVGLLHDLAKIAYHWGAEEDGNSGAEQWALVGDTFVLGCKIPDCVPLPQYNALSPYKDATDLGVYEPHCGLDNCTLSWGHDEHMYQVLVHHGTTIPPEGLHIIRYHSLYAHHQHDAYAHLCDEKDREFRKYVTRALRGTREVLGEGKSERREGRGAVRKMRGGEQQPVPARDPRAGG